MDGGGGEAARMGFGSDMKEYKVEYTLQNCTEDHDTCINLESTFPNKEKGCGTLKTYAETILSMLNLTIKNDECKIISGANNKNMKDVRIKGMEMKIENWKKQEIHEGFTEEDKEAIIKDYEKRIADVKKSKDRLKSLCTCSEDGCNGGNQVEAKLFMPVITAFIISQIFSS